MEEHGEMLNRFLVKVFNEILKTEERCLVGTGEDLSLRELHLIEAVCWAAAEGQDNRSAAIAATLRVTAGTLTTAVTLLEKKGYLERRRDEKDRRVVRILPTEKALLAEAHHAEFHREMVEHVLSILSPEETRVFTLALGSVADFFRRKYGETR